MTLMIGGRECVRGIDVAMYQPNIDYGVVKTVRDFAYIKASEGNSYADPRYGQHLNGFRSVGMPLGAYHYLQGGDGRVQAQNFLRVTNNYAGFQLPVAVDYEQAGVGSGVANAFIAEIERVIGKRWVGPTGQPVACIVYTGNYFNPNDRGNWAYMDMWLAAYTNRNYPNPGPEPQFLPVPGASRPWSSWSVWQCNGGDGRCPGVGGGQGQCDQNVATVEWFKRTTGGAVPQEDIVTPEQMAQLGQWMQEQSAAVVKALKPGIDATLVNVDPVGVAAGSPGTGPAYLRSVVEETFNAVMGIKPGGSVDVAALAALLADKLGDDVAKEVADELARRLAP